MPFRPIRSSMADLTGGESYLVRIGREVRERLASHPQTVKVPNMAIDLFVVRDFLDPLTCMTLIDMIETDHKPSTLMNEDPDPDFRTSTTCHMARHDRFVNAVEVRLTALTGIDPARGETLQGQRYGAGQQFKPHNDYFHTHMPYWPKERDRGGQRTWTAMIFLNDVAAGGHTRFPLLDLSIAPRRGNALVWNNLDCFGRPNPMTLHQGMPVLEGWKHIITKWYRERPAIIGKSHAQAPRTD